MAFLDELKESREKEVHAHVAAIIAGGLLSGPTIELGIVRFEDTIFKDLQRAMNGFALPGKVLVIAPAAEPIEDSAGRTIDCRYRVRFLTHLLEPCFFKKGSISVNALMTKENEKRSKVQSRLLPWKTAGLIAEVVGADAVYLTPEGMVIVEQMLTCPNAEVAALLPKECIQFSEGHDPKKNMWASVMKLQRFCEDKKLRLAPTTIHLAHHG